jgi:hypothetical protein
MDLIWNILRTFGIFPDNLVHYVLIWYTFPHFGIMDEEQSGNPDPRASPSSFVGEIGSEMATSGTKRDTIKRRN